MLKLKKVSIAIGLCAMMLVSILGTSANATIQDERAVTCCDRMSTYIYESKEYNGSDNCYNGSHNRPCSVIYFNHYRIKKCQNCGAVHSKTLSTTSSGHSSIIGQP